jgi:Ca2+-binding RTX toxin-like protein
MPEVVSVKGGNHSISVYGPKSSVFAGSGNDSIFVHGKDGFVSVGGGQDSIAMYEGGKVFEHGIHGHDTIDWGSGKLTVNVQGQATVYGSEAPGKFDLGLATIHGGEFKVSYSSESGLKETAVSGKMTLMGGRAPTEFVGGTGKTVMIGSNANDTFVGGSGSDTMTGGTKHNLFEFLSSEAGGKHVITNFVSTDKLYIEGHTLSYLQSHGDISTHDGNTYITIDGGKTTIELKGFTGLNSHEITTHKP